MYSVACVFLLSLRYEPLTFVKFVNTFWYNHIWKRWAIIVIDKLYMSCCKFWIYRNAVNTIYNMARSNLNHWWMFTLYIIKIIFWVFYFVILLFSRIVVIHTFSSYQSLILNYQANYWIYLFTWERIESFVSCLKSTTNTHKGRCSFHAILIA